MATLTGQLAFTSNIGQAPPASLAGAAIFYTHIDVGWKTVVSGTAANQSDLHYYAVLTLAATPTVLDLTALTDPFGASVNFARVKEVLIVNNSTTDGHNLLVGYATTTTHAFTSIVSNPGQITVGPSTLANNGFLLWVAPNTTGAAVSSTNKLLQLDPGANTFSITVEITGCSV